MIRGNLFRLLSRICSVAVLMTATGLPPLLAQAPDTPVLERRPIDWPDVGRSLAERKLLRAPPSERITPAALDNCRIPILLPAHEGLSGTMHVFPQPDSYAAFADRGTHTVEILGTRLARPDATSPEARALSRSMAERMERGTGRYIISRTEYGTDLNFSRFGAAYTISIICTEGLQDPACRRDDYILDLMNSMAFAGGRPETGEALPQGTMARPGDQ